MQQLGDNIRMRPQREVLKRIAGIAGVAILSLVLSIVSYLQVGLPIPTVHDEFSNLLQADTFAHGQLTNPSHPMARFFVTFHELQHPTYASKFPPGLGAALALGQVIWQPILGVWLAMALACAAITWAVQGWFRPGWSAVAGCIAAISPIVHFWTVCYWGGEVAMLGGALATAAALRAVRRPRAWHGAVGAVGAFVLFNSRPFEGALLCLLLATAVSIAAYRRPAVRRRLLTIVLPTAALLLAALGSFNLYYNWRVTGNAWELPYALDSRQTMYAPLMFWQKPTQPTERTIPWIRAFHEQVEWNEYIKQTGWAGYTHQFFDKSKQAIEQIVQPTWLAIMLGLGLLSVRGSRPARWAMLVCLALPAIHFLCTPWFRLQYLAPLGALFFALAVAGLVRLSAIRVRSQPIGWIVVVVLLAGMTWSSLKFAYEYDHASIPEAMASRNTLVHTLLARGGQHLVFVQHHPGGDVTCEACFNAADIDASPIVFARDLGVEQDRQLHAYYPHRQAWLFDNEQFSLTPIRFE